MKVERKKLVECGFCAGTGEEFGGTCPECNGAGAMEPCIYFIASSLRDGHLGPNGEPFMIVRADLRRNTKDGLPVIVESFHWSKEASEAIAADLTSKFHREVGNA